MPVADALVEGAVVAGTVVGCEVVTSQAVGPDGSTIAVILSIQAPSGCRAQSADACTITGAASVAACVRCGAVRTRAGTRRVLINSASGLIRRALPRRSDAGALSLEYPGPRRHGPCAHSQERARIVRGAWPSAQSTTGSRAELSVRGVAVRVHMSMSGPSALVRAAQHAANTFLLQPMRLGRSTEQVPARDGQARAVVCNARDSRGNSTGPSWTCAWIKT